MTNRVKIIVEALGEPCVYVLSAPEGMKETEAKKQLNDTYQETVKELTSVDFSKVFEKLKEKGWQNDHK